MNISIFALFCLFITVLTTAAATVCALRFAVVGDWGMGGRRTPWDPEIRSAAAVNEACETFFSEGHCNFTLSCGDNIYTGDVGMGLKESFGLFSKATGPFFPVSGNHDNIGPQLAYSKTNKRWKWPSRYYDFKVPIDDSGKDGHTAHFFAVDVMDGSLNNGGQYKWLEEKLKACNSRWKFFFGHYPSHGSGRHRREGSVMGLSSLMDKYNVQAYFSGHDHILDVNVAAGKLMGVSGAMSRGGMMIRGIAGPHHRWTLTQPGEFNANAVDWPGHGFFTCELSPNILTVHSWDHYGGIMYSFQTTYDWISKVHTKPKGLENKFPPEDEIRAAALAEKTLAQGPGGGKFYTLEGDEIDAPKYFEKNEDGTKGKRETEATVMTSFTKFADEHPLTTATKVDHASFTTTLAPEMKASQQQTDVLKKYVRYTVSSECLNCDRAVFANESFSIFVLGLDLKGNARVFVSSSKLGCEMSKYFPKFIEGTSIIQPMGNQAVFTATRAYPAVYTCLSLDAGKTYTLLKRADDDDMVNEFEIGHPRPEEQKRGTSNNNNVPNQNQPTQQQQDPTNQQQDQQQQQSSSTSTAGELLIVAGMSLLVGVGIATLSKSDLLGDGGDQQKKRQQPIPTSMDTD